MYIDVCQFFMNPPLFFLIESVFTGVIDVFDGRSFLQPWRCEHAMRLRKTRDRNTAVSLILLVSWCIVWD